MSGDEDRLKQYWRAISELNDRLIAATALMRDWAAEIPAPGHFDVLESLVANPAVKFTEILSRGGTGWPQSRRPVPQDEAVPQLVSVADNRFVEGLMLLLEEIRDQLSSLPQTELRRSVENLLQGNVHTIARRFDSFTEAWDHLVILKFETSVPNRRRRRIDAWFLAVVGLAERFIRDVIGVTILLGGKELVTRPLLACYSSPNLDVPQPTAEQLVYLPSAEAAVTDAVMNFMDRGSRSTMLYAKEFAAAFGPPLYPPEEIGFRPGILDSLTFLRGDVEGALTQLFDWRRSIVHETTRELRTGAVSQRHELLYELDHSALRLIPDFLCAFCFGLAVRILVTAGTKLSSAHPGLVSGLRFQLSGELRVLLKQLLTDERYELAWAVAQTALVAEPPGPAMMVRLNAYFARLQFDRDRLDLDEIHALDVGGLPRYNLLKRCLIGELRQPDTEPLLNMALSSGDMSLNELLTWPALRPLRECEWWNSWLGNYI